MLKENLLKTAEVIFAKYHLAGDPHDFMGELEADKEFLGAIEAKIAPVPEFMTKRFESILQLGAAFKTVQYLLLRATAPLRVVETGVLHGLSSAFLLNALDRNQRGELISIDLPADPAWADRAVSESGYVDSDDLPLGHGPGWAVPDALRKRWSLQLGAARQLLPEILAVSPCDYFVHDSEHTYEHMSFELDLAWNHLAGGTFIVCDNIDWCEAFADFCRFRKVDPVLVSGDGIEDPVNARFGIVCKP